MSLNHPFTYAHPASMLVVARLLGMRPADITTARILQIGAGSGHQALALAATLPRATVHATDPNADHITAASAVAAELGLQNLTLRHAPYVLENPTDNDAPFDYIIAHGLFSLLPLEQRGPFLQAIAQRLGPNGVAYVDYATYPGQHLEDVARNLMHLSTDPAAATAERLATAADVLTFIGETSMEIERTAFSAMLLHYADGLAADADQGTTTAVLGPFAPHFAPVYFHEFATSAARAGLRFLYEADFGNTMPDGLTPELLATVRVLSRGSIERREQYTDFLINRNTRQSLLVNSTVPTVTNVDPDHLMRFRFRTRATPLRTDEASLPDTFILPNDEQLRLQDAMTAAAIYALWYAAPDCLTWPELGAAIRSILGIDSITDAQRDALLEDLMRMYGNNTQLVHVVGWRAPLIPGMTERPVAFKVARTLHKTSQSVPNIWGESVTIPPLVGLLLPHLNGDNNQNDLLAVMATWVDEGLIQLSAAAERADVLLRQLNTLLRWCYDHALLVD